LIKHYFKSIRAGIKNFVRETQKIFLMVLLFILYFFGFGITLCLLVIFNRRALTSEYHAQDTYWHKTKGYAADIDRSLRQS